MEEVSFEAMSDDRVLERVEVLVARSNQLTAELLTYLAEVERRGLHLSEACPSLFAFCVERLHMSEGAAGKRITAMRVARRFPHALDMIARGEIHLTGVNLMAAHLSEENHAELLGRARHRSKREIEKLVAEIAPRPDVPSRVVALPRQAVAIGVEEHAPGRPGRVEGPHAPGRAAPVGVGEHASCASSRPAVIEPLAPRRYQIRVTVGEEAHAALVQLQDLLSHQVPDRDPAVIISRALELLLERTLASKAAVTGRPRAQKAPEKRTRHIPAAVRREVWQRDQGRCAFLDAKGRRCSATRFLEFHHIDNWARGAEHRPDEIELRCRAHNLYQAVLDYGAAFMARRTQSAPTRAEEPRPTYASAAAEGARRQTTTETSSWRTPEGRRTRRTSASGSPCTSIVVRTISRRRARGAYLKRPSLATRRVPASGGDPSRTGHADPLPTSASRCWNRVSASSDVSPTTHASESPTLAPAMPPSATRRMMAVVCAPLALSRASRSPSSRTASSAPSWARSTAAMTSSAARAPPGPAPSASAMTTESAALTTATRSAPTRPALATDRATWKCGVGLPPVTQAMSDEEASSSGSVRCAVRWWS